MKICRQAKMKSPQHPQRINIRWNICREQKNSPWEFTIFAKWIKNKRKYYCYDMKYTDLVLEFNIRNLKRIQGIRSTATCVNILWCAHSAAKNNVKCEKRNVTVFVIKSVCSFGRLWQGWYGLEDILSLAPVLAHLYHLLLYYLHC